MKYIGGILILVGGALVGIYFIRQLKHRTNVLSDMLLSLTTLQNEISFGHAALDEAFLRLSGIEGDVGRFYLRCCESMEMIPKVEFEKIWRENIALLFEPLIFSKREREILLSLGAGLGAADSASQTRTLAYAYEELSRIKESALEEERKKARMYMGLSMIAAAVVIIAAV